MLGGTRGHCAHRALKPASSSLLELSPIPGRHHLGAQLGQRSPALPPARTSAVMGLQPLEFSDCYLDSPWFRERIRAGSGAGEDQQVLQRAHQRWEEPHRCHQK
ncbi:Rho GTPase-activating protein 10 [Lemmus lemmus]